MASRPVSQIPVGSGKNFTGVVDLLSNQKLIWKLRSMGDDGRTFESRPLDQSDEPELLQEVDEARAALIEQVHVITSTAMSTIVNIEKTRCSRFLLQFMFLFSIPGCRSG